MRPSHCARCWTYWAGATALSFAYLEGRGYVRACHPTLSRELRRWTGNCPARPWVFTVLGLVAGAAMDWHLKTLKDLASPIPKEFR